MRSCLYIIYQLAELGNVLLILLFLQKLSKKHQEDPEKFKTIQDIVNSEIEAGTTKAKNSATDALLWLKRYTMAVHRIDVLSAQYKCYIVIAQFSATALIRFYNILMQR